MKTPHALVFAWLLAFAWAKSSAQEPAPTAPPPTDQQPATALETAPTPAAPVVEGLAELGSAIPEHYGNDRYEATFKKNPFATRTVAPPGPQGPGLADDWELKGIIDQGGVQKALISNKKTAETKRVSSTPDKDGFVLVKMNFAKTRKERSVEIAKGTETATLNFAEVAAPAAPGARPQGVAPGLQPQGAVARPYGGNVPVSGPGGIRPTGAQPQRAPTSGQMPNVNAPGTVPGQPGIPAPSTGSRRRLLVPTPMPAPGQSQ